MLKRVEEEVYKLLDSDKSGHNSDHIKRVLSLALKFADLEGANRKLVTLIALLHDVDDDKFVNAKRIMNEAGVDSKSKEIVLSELSRFGYSKSLEGIRPLTLEGKIVSDADMCDALGVNGFLRCYSYSISRGGVLFDRNIYPRIFKDANEYRGCKEHIAINHMFEKILKLKGLMLTEAGKKEASLRHECVIYMMRNLFIEEEAIEWKEYLEKYLKESNKE